MTKGGGTLRSSRRGFLTLVGLGLMTAGCASSTPSALYSLNAVPQVDVRRRRAVQVLVPRPRALKALDTDLIAAVEQGQLISYFPQSAWSDALPNVVQAKIVEALQNTGSLRGVGMPGDGLLIDYQLQTDIRSFAFYTEGSDRGVVEISARLVNDRNGRTVSTKVFRSEILAGGQTVGQAVEALNAASSQVLGEMTAWAISKV